LNKSFDCSPQTAESWQFVEIFLRARLNPLQSLNASLQTVIATAKHKGKVVFQSLADLMRAPVLTLLEALSS
jgi:hypothetical protein